MLGPAISDKKFAFILSLCIAVASVSRAQTTAPSSNFAQYAGKTATLCDTVYSFKKVSDTLTLVDMGGYYLPDPAKVEKAMRPSPTLNAIINSI